MSSTSPVSRVLDAAGPAIGVPATITVWLANLDMVLRICVSIGTLVVIAMSIWHKLQRMRREKEAWNSR